jgi:hypothetical protein
MCPPNTWGKNRVCVSVQNSCATSLADSGCRRRRHLSRAEWNLAEARRQRGPPSSVPSTKLDVHTCYTSATRKKSGDGMCEERHRLVSEYVAAAKRLSGAVGKLQGLHWDAFTQAMGESEAARAECGKAREALLLHETDHEGCTGPLRRRAEARAACR